MSDDTVTMKVQDIFSLRAELTSLQADIATYVKTATDQQEEIERLRIALAVCADDHRISAEQFAFYAEQHRAKSPPDETKAATNDLHAVRCAAASFVSRQISVNRRINQRGLK